MLKPIHLCIYLNFWWKLTASTFKHPSSFREGWKKFIKLFAANAITWNKLWASHQSWCLITTMGYSERRKSFQILVGFTSSEWLPDGALSCLEIPPGVLELPMHSAAGWKGSLCHHRPECETQLITSVRTHGQRERLTVLPKLSRSSLSVRFTWFINSLGLGSKILQLEREDVFSSCMDFGAVLPAKAREGFKNPFSVRGQELQRREHEMKKMTEI